MLSSEGQRSVQARVVAVDGARELRLGGVPLVGGLEGDVRGGVVHHCEGGHPEVVPQPGHEPELHNARDAGVVADEGDAHQRKGCHCCQRHQHLQQTCRLRKLCFCLSACCLFSVQLEDYGCAIKSKFLVSSC